MFQKLTSFYLENKKKMGFSGVINREDFFLVIEIEEGLSQEEGEKKLAQLQDLINGVKIEKLSDFEALIIDKIKECDFPANISAACGYLKEKVLYLKTIGKGKVYLRRGNKFGLIIEKEQSASGYIKNKDMFILTTENFLQVVGREKKIQNICHDKKPDEITNQLNFELKEYDYNIAALFIQFDYQELESDIKVKPPLFTSNFLNLERVVSKINNFYNKLQDYSSKTEQKKKYTFIVIIILLFILIWSVGLGYQRRSNALLDRKIKEIREKILQKLNQADESAFFEIDRSLTLIEEAKKDLLRLEKDIGTKKQKEIQEIRNLIKEKEAKITRKEEKQHEEFYDLAIDSKYAKGSAMYLDGDNLCILDKNQGIIYVLSLSKKSLEKNTFDEIKSANKVAGYQEALFFFSDNGIYKINSEKKLTKVIEKDKDWGKIIDLWLYNGNIYLLDEEKDEIYKYLVVENGYSGKTSYLKSGINLEGANSLSIDASIYIGFPDRILKFTSGNQEEFNTSFPEKNISITKVFTTKNLEKIYAWDKKNGVIYILGKTGDYEREIYSPVLKQIDDFIVFSDKAYLLFGQKIYVIPL